MYAHTLHLSTCVIETIKKKKTTMKLIRNIIQ